MFRVKVTVYGLRFTVYRILELLELLELFNL